MIVNNIGRSPGVPVHSLGHGFMAIPENTRMQETQSPFGELVQRRRSVRRYMPGPVSRSLVDQCLEAARLAPSACNSQPWSFLVVDEPGRRDRLAAAAFAGVYAMCAFARQAPVLVAMVTERSRFSAALGGLWRGVQYNLVDIGIAGEHFALQAAELGLGTCWLGWFDEKAVRRELALPRGTRVDILFALGWPADAPPPAGQVRRPLDAIRRYVD